MQYIDHWPDIAELVLPEIVTDSLYQKLIEPFDSELLAKEFWKETFCSIIVLSNTDSINQLRKSDAWSQIETVITYTEFTETLKMNYQLMVAIVNDSGTGLFMVVPPGLTLLNSEG